MTLRISGDIVLKNYNRPAAIAGVAPTLDYRFALDRRELDAVSLTDKLTVTRAATAAVNGPTGYLELAGPNVARFDHSPTTNQSLGLLVEESSTNLLTYSEELNQGSWFKVNGAITATVLSPAYTLTASTVFINSGATYVRLQRSNLGLASGVYTLSYYVKNTINIGLNTIQVLDSSNTSLIENPYNFSSTTTPNWTRCEVTLDISNSALTNLNVIRIDFRPSPSPSTGSSTVDIWGVQLEEGSSSTSYIPTEISTVTRTESATIDGTGVITGTYTMVEKPAGCAVVNGTNIDLQTGYTAERVMVFPAALSSEQITAIRSVM